MFFDQLFAIKNVKANRTFVIFCGFATGKKGKIINRGNTRSDTGSFFLLSDIRLNSLILILDKATASENSK